MLSSKAALYRFILILSLVVYVWVGYNLFRLQRSGVPAPQVCLLKRTTDVPCPFCGTTRSVMFASHGQFVEAFFSNPIGLIFTLIITICPLWILIDFILRKETFYRLFTKVKSLLKPRWWLIVFFLIITLIWFWNIRRGL